MSKKTVKLLKRGDATCYVELFTGDLSWPDRRVPKCNNFHLTLFN